MKKEVEGNLFIIVRFSGKVDLSQLGDMSKFIKDNSTSGKAYMIAIDDGFHFGFAKLSLAIDVAEEMLKAPLLAIYNEATDPLKRFFSAVASAKTKYPMHTTQSREDMWKRLAKAFSDNCVEELKSLLLSSPDIVIET